MSCCFSSDAVGALPAFSGEVSNVFGAGKGIPLVDGVTAHFAIPSGSPRRETVVDTRMVPVDRAASSCRVIAASPAAPDSVPTCHCVDRRSSRAPSSSGSSRSPRGAGTAGQILNSRPAASALDGDGGSTGRAPHDGAADRAQRVRHRWSPLRTTTTTGLWLSWSLADSAGDRRVGSANSKHRADEAESSMKAWITTDFLRIAGDRGRSIRAGDRADIDAAIRPQRRRGRGAALPPLRRGPGTARPELGLRCRGHHRRSAATGRTPDHRDGRRHDPRLRPRQGAELPRR